MGGDGEIGKGKKKEGRGLRNHITLRKEEKNKEGYEEKENLKTREREEEL